MKDKPSSRLQKITYRENIPLTVIWELTRRCNLNCRHCYIPSSDRYKKFEISFNRIKSILQNLASSGTMYLIFTGGEIFVREDAIKIISCAREIGFDVRIFTNGTLLDSKNSYLVRSLSRMGVSAVEISLYGPKDIHDYITGVDGSYSKAILAIDNLVSLGVKVVLKSPIMNLNFKARHWLYDFAHRRGIVPRFDPMITLSEDESTTNLNLRLNENQLKKIHKEFAPFLIADYCDLSPPPKGNALKNSGHKKKTDKIREIVSKRYCHKERLFYCGAGRNFAAISYNGMLYPCLQLKVPLGDLKKNDFKSLWRPAPKKKSFQTNPLSFIRETFLSRDSECFKCAHLIYCPRCPGMALIEGGGYENKNPASCQLARARAQTFDL